MKVLLDAERCTGHGRCYVLGPEVFEEDERGRCVLLHSEVPRELEKQARLGAENCPEKAIRIVEG